MRIALAACLASLLAVPAAAADRPVLVELFTSQGCSSCPPADKFMEELAARGDVVALTLPVDIWDYLGWRDSFARHEFSLRQQAYAPKMPSRSVFTPQMVVGGAADVVGSRREEAEKLIQTLGAEGMKGAELTLAIDGDTLNIDIAANPDLADTRAQVFLARVLARGEVTIGDGENRGKQIVYSNVVRELTELGTWDGDEAGHFEAPVAAHLGQPYDRLAVFVQAQGQGQVLAAALLPLPAPAPAAP